MQMLTPDYLKNVANDAINIYSKLEDSIIKDKNNTNNAYNTEIITFFYT